MNTKEQDWEGKFLNKFNKTFQALYEFPYVEFKKPPEGLNQEGIPFRGMYVNKDLLDFIGDFIRETREQAYQKGLDDGYDEGFRACEKGVTP